MWNLKAKDLKTCAMALLAVTNCFKDEKIKDQWSDRGGHLTVVTITIKGGNFLTKRCLGR
jgi:hypothetical protein